MAKTTFWKYLKENEIVIPIIQRDYAQGRIGKESLRKKFLLDLKNALDAEDAIKMKLDFVYGSTEKCKLNPLDGQQRLTTLWLLHWYIALRAGKLNEENCIIFQRFTYETRISSREFCENLCNSKHFEKFDGNDIVGFITKQTWFYSAWKQDPTIQSMLRMLGGTKINDKNGDDIIDGIEELFDCPSECNIIKKDKCSLLRVFHKYWNKLISDDCPIVFYHLSLNNFGLSDDLYIKMNARGKQLTSFENFKTDLIGYITNQSEDESFSEEKRKPWNNLLDANNGIPINLDCSWANIFWSHRSKDNRIDDIYYAFINRFMLNALILLKKEDGSYCYTAKDIEEKNLCFNYLYGNKSDDTKILYDDLGKYYMLNGIPYVVFDSLQKTLNNFNNENINIHFPSWVDTSFLFIPEYEKDDISKIGQKERIVFFAVCSYLTIDRIEPKSFQQWMRIVWNIVENADVNTISSMIGTMRLIDELSQYSHNIYQFLASDNLIIQSDAAKEQVAEEIAKANQILKGSQRTDGESWEETIMKAERYTFFKGAIRFLFTNDSGNIDWDNFDVKWKNAQVYFNEKGMAEEYKDNAKLLRYYISKFKEWWEFGDFDYDNKPSTWKKLLISTRYMANHIILMNLLGKDCEFSSFDSSLEKYEEGYKELQEEVQNELVRTNILVKSSEWSMKLNWRNYYNCYCLYPYNTKASWKIYVIANKRNQILSQLHNNEVINTKNRIKDCDFFWGWDIPFEYDNFNFQWNIDGLIYLMDNGKNKEPKEEYSINANELENANSLIHKMKELIKSKFTNE